MKDFKEIVNEEFTLPFDRGTSLKPSDMLYKSTKGKSGFFVVVPRNTAGMRGTQDKYEMYVVDEDNRVQMFYGSHPSLNGAKGFGKSKGYK